jgi:RNA polymerase sigma-70 factor (ECF subfamily)
MTMDHGDWLAERFQEHRARLRAVAYRMLGSAGEADDAVQEAWLRFSRTDTSAVQNLGGWLTTVVSRVCLNMLQARRLRPESPFGGQVPEPAAADPGADPEYEALLADSVGLALMVVLDTLTPAERVAFVLHDMFAVPFEEIGPIVGRSTQAARQLASRARRRVQGQEAARHGDRRRQARLVDAFLAAARHGNFSALLAVLDPDVALRADTVAVRLAIARQAEGAPPLSEKIRGREAVAEVFAGHAAAARAAVIDGNPGAVWAPEGRARAAFVMRWSEDRIVEIEIVADPRRLRALEIVL